MHAVGEVDVQLLLGVAVVRDASTISYTAAGQKYWQGLPYSFTQRCAADVQVLDHQMHRLIVVVPRARVIDVRQPVERQLAVALRVAQKMLRPSP